MPTINETKRLIDAYIGAGVAQFISQAYKGSQKCAFENRGEWEIVQEIIESAGDAFDSIPAFVPLTDVLYTIAETYGFAASERIESGWPFDPTIARQMVADLIAGCVEEWED